MHMHPVGFLVPGMLVVWLKIICNCSIQQINNTYYVINSALSYTFQALVQLL